MKDKVVRRAASYYNRTTNTPSAAKTLSTLLNAINTSTSNANNSNDQLASTAMDIDPSPSSTNRQRTFDDDDSSESDSDFNLATDSGISIQKKSMCNNSSNS
ncbi:unnamed protein product, partial [Rotaria sp. Silwood1]